MYNLPVNKMAFYFLLLKKNFSGHFDKSGKCKMLEGI